MDSYVLQFEPTARRLFDNAVAAGSLDKVAQVSRRYFLTASGASATFLIGLSQFERGDYTAAFLTLERLHRLHPAIPEAIKPALVQTLAAIQSLDSRFHDYGSVNMSSWLEQSGWRLPSGSPSQHVSTKSFSPLLEKTWSVPVFNRSQWSRETEILTRMLRGREHVYVPASQPLVVGDLFITRLPGETIAVDVHSGKRLWIADEPVYRHPNGSILPPRPSAFAHNSRTALRLYFWHDRIAHQLSSDGERLFSIDEHDIHSGSQSFGGRGIPNLQGRGEDLRYAPGNTLTARDIKTGQLIWQAGKFPYVQKYINDILGSRPPATSQNHADRINADRINVDGSIFTEDEQSLMDTWFLGVPLPLQGRLYVIGESDGVLQLMMLESQTGKLLARQSFAQVSDAQSSDIRRTYPLFPSASQGLILCPSGSGIIAALDATTLAPIWCYTYTPATRSAVSDNRHAFHIMRNRQLPLFHRAQNESAINNLFSDSGWQVPSMIISGHRVLVAPPDRATLLCLDLQSGELLWEQTVSRANTLYVAGIHNHKAFLVTPVNLMMIDMTTGKNLTDLENRFPETLKPAGVGVRSGEQYFIPFTEGHLAVADLNDGTLTWLETAPPIHEPASTSRNEPQRNNDLHDGFHDGLQIRRIDGRAQAGEWRFEGRIEIQFGGVLDGGNFDVIEQHFHTSGRLGGGPNADMANLPAIDSSQQPIRFGNLVGIKGRFFSQSPTQIASFDQLEPLRDRAEALLQADANDPEGLRQQGRILKSEGQLREAIEFFRSSLRSRYSADVADALRRSLLEAMRKDYSTWSHAAEELESFAEFPEDKAAILLAQIEGGIQSDNKKDLTSLAEKVFVFGREHSILVPVDDNYSAQLPLALRSFLYESELGALTPAHSAENTRGPTPPARTPPIPWRELTAPSVWGPKVDVYEVPITPQQPLQPGQDNEIAPIIERLVGLAQNPSPVRPGEHPAPIPTQHDGVPHEYNYFIKQERSGFVLSCADLARRELWQLALPPSITSGFTEGQARSHNNRYSGELTTYIKGIGHYLVLVHGTTLLAVDATPKSERVLWSKTLTSVPITQQGGVRMNNLNQRPNPGAMPFPKNAVLISPHAVCYWDANAVHALAPMTGQTLWVRRVHTDSCTLLGDDKHLFIAQHDVNRVLAVDIETGRELESAVLPEGGVYIYGTNIIFLQQRDNHYTLSLVDLRDIFDRRRRALLGGLPAETLQSNLRNATMLQTFRNDRFLSVATWDTKTLQVYDLSTQGKLLPENNTMLDFVPPENMRQTRCDVELVGEHFLVLFTKGTQFRNSNELVRDEENRQVRRHFRQVNEVLGIPIDEGMMMLFDSAGNACWEQPVQIEKMTRLLEVPDCLPVMLFAVGYDEINAANQQRFASVRIMGIDKRSGAELFRKRFALEQIAIQPFRVSVDIPAQTILFTNNQTQPPRTVRAVFADE